MTHEGRTPLVPPRPGPLGQLVRDQEHVYALDPGLEHPAAAYLRDGKLVRSTRVRVGEWKKLSILARADLVAASIVDWFRPFRVCTAATLVVEFPQWYSETKSRGADPNDLAGLATIAGAVLARMRCEGYDLAVMSPRPREVWGNLPKNMRGDPWSSPRGRRLAGRLSAAERASVQDYHDALDAAGLALWAAGRWAPRRLFPGAS